MSKNQKGKGLGRGIDALFMNDLDTIDALEQVQDSEQIQQIAVSEIRPNPYQPRKEFDEEGLAELAESIRQNGVFQPIIVRKSKIKGYELVAGERRLRASKLAEKETIPAIVRDYSEETMIQIAVVENLQRENLKPLDEAMAYRTLMDSLKLKQEEVANRVGKSRSYVANFLRLLTLPVPVQELVQSGELTSGHARTLLGLKDQTKILPVAKKAVKEGLTVRALEQLVQSINEPAKKVAKKVAKTIGIPKCSNNVRVAWPIAAKIAQYFKALEPTLNTKANPTAGMAAKSISSSKFSKNILLPHPRNNI